MINIGSKIKQVRKERKLTQREFSKAICISQPHLSKIEHNEENPSKAVVKLICILFDVSENWIINGN